MMRTFANVGMVFSFSVAILVASRSISRQLAFAIFVGTTSLHGEVADAFTTGLHAAFYASVIFMVIAAVLSALRAGGIRRPGGSAARTPSERADLQVEGPGSTAAGLAKTSAVALSMITKEKSPMRALFFRDHEISGLRPAVEGRRPTIMAAAPGPWLFGSRRSR
jgi:hypothetical protein